LHYSRAGKNRKQCGTVESDIICQFKENMAAQKTATGSKKIGGQPQEPGKFPKAKFGLFGVEIIEKEVKPKGNSGRIYLPANWVGKLVKIVRVD
jgi:hypothetical protein